MNLIRNLIVVLLSLACIAAGDVKVIKSEKEITELLDMYEYQISPSNITKLHSIIKRIYLDNRKPKSLSQNDKLLLEDFKKLLAVDAIGTLVSINKTEAKCNGPSQEGVAQSANLELDLFFPKSSSFKNNTVTLKKNIKLKKKKYVKTVAVKKVNPIVNKSGDWKDRLIKSYASKGDIRKMLAVAKRNINCKNISANGRCLGSKSRTKSVNLCYRFTKRIIEGAGIVKSGTLTGSSANKSISDMERSGFVNFKDRLTVNTAPVGAIIVYGDSAYGHIEVKGENNKFYSDLVRDLDGKRDPRRVIGIFLHPKAS